MKTIHFREKLKTHVIRKYINPEWNEDLTLSISDPDLPIKLEIDEYELVDHVDILTPLEKTILEWSVAKWSERKEVVAELTKLASTKRIAPGDFTEIYRTLKKGYLMLFGHFDVQWFGFEVWWWLEPFSPCRVSEVDHSIIFNTFCIHSPLMLLLLYPVVYYLLLRVV
ncbi:uncharacterized protein LOC114290352 [Camellia sinensis]|uniref:uncharacterized protein LOC114290352 n=1 Tax=Camellia sinensis TaxID=4442 RepID=UPI00103696EB|nr:uncharacterized protein LOC114290352 [Camellia sinensis]XP_028090030.1 uncharacterized protein LOC114290352 [Camellia sinensis]